MLRPMNLAAFLDLRGERALVVGGGPVALRRTRTLLEAGLHVTVIAPELHPDFVGLPVEVQRRVYQPADLSGRRVVVCATNRPDVNDEVAAGARAAGALVSHAGEAARGNLRFPAVTRRGAVQVAVSSGRELPLLAQALGERIAALLPGEATLDAWAARREQALVLPPAERVPELAELRADIRAALGLPEADLAAGGAA